jgi:hypothetical protein
MNPIHFPCRTFFWLLVAGLLFMAGRADALAKNEDMPADVLPALHYLLDLAKNDKDGAFDAQRIEPFMRFLLSPKPADSLYTTGDSFDAPSAFHEYSIHTGVKEIVDYTLDDDIPSYFFWPSSLRLSRWTRVDGGDRQFGRLKAASNGLNAPFILKGAEHIAITPDQHTGAYYTYDVDKMIILSPFKSGRVMITIYMQQAPSAVGKKGWVLGNDDEWSYLYTQDKGLSLNGLGWVNTYMYDSFGITVYYQPDAEIATLTCGTVSWVKAGWSGINMVKPKHIHKGLVRVATAFKDIIENPRLPEPATLAETFSKSKSVPTPTLREYARDYLDGLEQRIASSETLSNKLNGAFDNQTLVEQMTRDELYAVLALDYFKKILGRNPVMKTHPF